MTNSLLDRKRTGSKNSINLKNCKPDNVVLDRSLSFRHMLEGDDLSEQPVLNKEKPEVISVPEKHDIVYTPRTYEAAVKVQKVYRSYRIRRNLADCAVVVEELWWRSADRAVVADNLWWKAIDYAVDYRSSVSFYDNNAPESVVSRWSRARKRVAKLGKGLSRDEKAQQLALQHWLEAIDPRHRYGHNLHFYYKKWFQSESAEPFFYWLDVGHGKDVNLEKCPRADLQKQCIQYLGPKEREAYEVVVRDGKLVFKQRNQLVTTTEGSKWIFVLSTSRSLYVGQKKKGEFQHSSFLAGAATTAAGRMVAKNGILEAVWPYSGHYQPKEEHFREFIIFLQEHNVDLSNVKRYSIDGGNPSYIVSKSESGRLDGADAAIADTDARAEKPVFSFARRMSCKWNSGVGPRIGCVRDYPAELQSQALEQVNLSPRIAPGPLPNYGRPIPSPRPSPKFMVSPRLAYMGVPSPRTSVGCTN